MIFIHQTLSILNNFFIKFDNQNKKYDDLYNFISFIMFNVLHGCVCLILQLYQRPLHIDNHIFCYLGTLNYYYDQTIYT